MRDFLDAILSFIGSESLTDIEYSDIDLEDEEYTLETYEALKATLQERESVSTQFVKLQSYFTAKGVNLSEDISPTPTSNILIGGSLDE